MKNQMMRGFGLAEKLFQRLQGKGYGAATMRREAQAALPFLPDRNAIVFDIGANHGDWTRALLSLAGPRIGRIYDFEPSTHNHPDIEAIGDARVTLVPSAVSDAGGEAVLHYDSAGSGLASLTRRRLDHHGIEMGIEERVQTVALDAFIAAHGLSRVDFVKIDIEGHEFSALKSAQHSLATHVIRALAFEFGGTNIDTRVFFQDFWYLLTGHGYRIARINPLFGPVEIRRYTESEENFLIANYVAYLP